VDLVASLTGGKLRYALAELAALPRAALVVEDRYSQFFTLQRVRPAVVADGLAELQVRWPNVPIVYAETRPLAEEWTYRYLAAAHAWAADEDAAVTRIGPQVTDLGRAPAAPGPSTAEIRAWAREHGHPVPDRGRLRPEIIDAWHTAHPPGPKREFLSPIRRRALSVDWGRLRRTHAGRDSYRHGAGWSEGMRCSPPPGRTHLRAG